MAALVAAVAVSSAVGAPMDRPHRAARSRTLAPDAVDFGLTSLRVRVRRRGQSIHQTVVRIDDGGRATEIGRIGIVHSVLPVGLRSPEHGLAWAVSVNLADEPVLVTATPWYVSEQTFSFGSTLHGVAMARDGLWFSRSHTAAGTRELYTPHGVFDLPAAAVWDIVPADDGAVFAYDGGDGAGVELWGVTAEGDAVQRLADVNPGVGSSQPREFFVVGDLVWFTADDGAHGREAYVCDPSTGDVRSLGDLRPGPESSEPRVLGDDLGTLWIGADDGVTGREPWRVDLAAKTATLVEQEPGPGSSNPTGFAVTRGAAFTYGREPTGLVRVWALRGSGGALVAVPQDVGARTYFLTSHRGDVSFVHEHAVAGTPGGVVEVHAADAAPASTASDADADGFTDDVELAVGTDPADARRTPAGGARAVDAGTAEVRTLRAVPGHVDVSFVLPADESEWTSALPPEGLILSVGGAVAGAFLGEGQRTARDGRSTLRRAVLTDERVLVRARIVGRRTAREEGADGTVPVLVWRDAARYEPQRTQ
jgi:ELWxxDGT repeat protein